MKKALYGTTALVAAGALMASPASAEEKIKLGLGGYMNMHFGVGDTDHDNGPDYEATNVRNEGEVWFRGETTLDNGITFGANVQLETFQASDRVDEAYGYVSGSFGRVLIGSENTAAYLMQYSAPSVGVPVNSGWISTFITPDGDHLRGAGLIGGGGFRTPLVSTNVDLGTIGNDEQQVTYFTPRFSGFQVGVSYTPAFTGIGLIAGPSGDGQLTAALSDGQFQHGISLGVNYVQTFNDIDIAVAGGYVRAESPDNSGIDDPEQFSAGLNVGFAGFTVGASYAQEDWDLWDVWSYDVGATYSTGPWTVGVTYFHSETNEFLGVDIEDQLDAISAGIAYAVGPGIEANASVLWAEWDADGDFNLNGNATAGDDDDGIVAVIGMTYSF